jgi:hypothetical protein
LDFGRGRDSASWRVGRAGFLGAGLGTTGAGRLQARLGRSSASGCARSGLRWLRSVVRHVVLGSVAGKAGARGRPWRGRVEAVQGRGVEAAWGFGRSADWSRGRRGSASRVQGRAWMRRAHGWGGSAPVLRSASSMAAVSRKERREEREEEAVAAAASRQEGVRGKLTSQGAATVRGAGRR